MIIAIEGIDGAGKNTLVRALAEALPGNVTSLAFPRYGTQFADLAADALHGKVGDLVDSIYGMALMFALDRQAALPQLQAHTEGILLLDRYVASNAAYTSARLNDDAGADWVADLEFDRFALPTPDLTILLATPAEVARSRARSREESDSTRTRDAYERDASLQERTLAHYQRLADSQWHGPWLVAPTDVDVHQLASEVAARIATQQQQQG
ncbi:thymidylate kinase [Corynebacterium sp. 13CS0277]|uniref:dTMP kinase n=1 Tax=Corynebacterium sp. 13CS0277 TaxID=2071994 RepID=UPI000D03E41F|nr:dTMP kinase [Corynebacterium sp. 13CS0277]PRQ10783.1 thymidylate kinase [Corynebacterium sp. 13CS0277]